MPLHAYVLCIAEAAGFVEGPDAGTTLDSFAALNGGQAATTRDTADVAVLLVAELDKDTCGIGYINSIAAGKTLSTVKKVCAWSFYTVGHEIGHNIGLDHDPANAVIRPYPYATGHLIEGSGDGGDDGSDAASGDDDEDEEEKSPGFRTIMAYSAKGHETRVNYYSNPNVLFLETRTPTGVEMSNNAMVLLKNRFRLAEVGDESSLQCQDGNSDQDYYNGDDSDDDDDDDDSEYDAAVVPEYVYQ